MITPEQKIVMDLVISVFENETLNLQYDYIENLKDGRGYTAGRAGFTSRDGDMLEVLSLFKSWGHTHAITEFIPLLTKLNDKNSGSTLQLCKLPSAWKDACQFSDFKAAQDKISDKEYFIPASNLAERYGVKTPLGVLIFYDTAIQHGIDGDDGLIDILRRCGWSVGSVVYNNLCAFLTTRIRVLENPRDASTKKEWSESVGRVRVLQRLLITMQNNELITPFTINPYGTPFTL